MTEIKKPAASADLGQWRVGTRVSRKTSNDLGTVTETTGKVKIKWDNGQTSYFNHGKSSNVILGPDEMKQLAPMPITSTIAVDVESEHDAVDLARTIANLVGKPVTVYDKKGFQHTVEPDPAKH